MMRPDIANDILRRFQAATNDRGTWESHWEEVAKRVWPNYSGSFIGASTQTSGDKRTEEMVDASAALALSKFAAVMESMLTPRNSRWHRLIPHDRALRRNRQVRLWLEETTDILFKYRNAPRANFQSQWHESLMSLGAFGTGVMFVDALDRRWGGGLRYRAVHLGEVYFLENHQGIIDTCYRRFDLTARQAVQRFGEEKLPKQIREAAKDESKCDTKFWFVHCVRPRDESEGYSPGRMDVKGMAFASYTVSETERVMVREGGYNTFPFPISRYEQAPGETYGRGPAMLSLPSIKVLNEQKKTFLKQGHRAVDPPLLAYDDGVIDSISLRPGAINYGGVNEDGKLLVQAIPSGNLAWNEKMMDAERVVISDAFLLSLFQILTESPQMTATEVLERVREKGMLLAPTMGRQQSEALGPMIDREIDVLAQQGIIPPMPEILREAAGEYDVEYDSPLSRAARAEEAAGLMRTVEMTLNVVNVTQNPEPLDHFDWDTAVPDIADIQAVPMRWMRSLEKVMEIRAGRAQMQQAQMAIDAGPSVAAIAKAMPGKMNAAT